MLVTKKKMCLNIKSKIFLFFFVVFFRMLLKLTSLE